MPFCNFFFKDAFFLAAPIGVQTVKTGKGGMVFEWALGKLCAKLSLSLSLKSTQKTHPSDAAAAACRLLLLLLAASPGRRCPEGAPTLCPGGSSPRPP